LVEVLLIMKSLAFVALFALCAICFAEDAPICSIPALSILILN